MDSRPELTTSRLLWLGAGLSAMVVAALVLYFYDPETAGFYPLCTFHQLTGLECPGCGSLRALHQLTHGNFAAAWGFNPLLVAFLPVGLWIGLRQTVLWTLGWRWPGVVTRPIVGWAMLAVTLAFGVLRNLR